MPTIRFSGTIEAKTPILITRVGQGDRPLTMVVMDRGRPVRVPVIPGETLKGLLRSLAFNIAVEARKRADPAFTMSLEEIYEEAKGGVAFASGPNDLTFDDERRNGNPIVSLFGAASPTPIRGRLIIEPAMGRLSPQGSITLDMDLAEGVRRDPLLADNALIHLLRPGEEKKWSRQMGLIRHGAKKKKDLEDAQKALRKARRAQSADFDLYETKASEAAAEVEKFKQGDDYTLAVQRPLPSKPATPAGVIFDHRMEIRNASLLEIGLFLDTLRSWSLDLRIGGGRTAGYGRIELNYSIQILTSEKWPQKPEWLTVGSLRLGDSGMTLDAPDPTLEDAAKAWASAEEDIARAWTPK